MKLIVFRRRKNIEDEEAKVEKQVKLMLEQVRGRKEAEIKNILIEVCCGEESKLALHFKGEEGESTRIYPPKNDMSKDYTVKGRKRTIEHLQDESFGMKTRDSRPWSTWCSWQR